MCTPVRRARPELFGTTMDQDKRIVNPELTNAIYTAQRHFGHLVINNNQLCSVLRESRKQRKVARILSNDRSFPELCL